MIRTLWLNAVFCGITAAGLSAQALTTLVSFNGGDGANPVAPLIQGTNGDGYGTTNLGGASNGGTIFKISPSGALTTLYNLCAHANCGDGEFPQAALVQTTSGEFYGTTTSGGAGSAGTIFRISPSGTLTTLYSFCAQGRCADGIGPNSLLQGSDGNFYGTTIVGGTKDHGTVFKITPTGALTTIYSFCARMVCPDGEAPAGLIQGSDGNFYGVTSGGGYGSGTIFKITSSGNLTTLYGFCAESGCPDGSGPSALIQAVNGGFYGTTSGGGTAANGGTVFEITPSGTLTTLYSFCAQSGCTDGSGPVALLTATDGNSYGVTRFGGTNATGTVFKITPAGTLTTLYNFCSLTGCADGSSPTAGLAQATNGVFYGTTYYGGANGDGTVFSISAGLGPFVKVQPDSGKTGAAVDILGTDLTGATSVTFNGAPAVFTVASSSLITTTVPTGATSGKVQVVTPGGTLSSNVGFRIVR